MADPDRERRLASVGREYPGVRVWVVDENDQIQPAGQIGEVVTRSDLVMKGYWNSSSLTADIMRNGWLHTGDMGRYDKDGYVYIVDRKKDMIITGGENVYPREVEETMYAHPAISECAVFGIPHSKWVEAVHAVVVLKSGATTTPEDLIAFCKEKIAGYKAPKSVEIVEEIPKSATGKILKREMKKKYWP